MGVAGNARNAGNKEIEFVTQRIPRFVHESDQKSTQACVDMHRNVMLLSQLK